MQGRTVVSGNFTWDKGQSFNMKEGISLKFNSFSATLLILVHSFRVDFYPFVSQEGNYILFTLRHCPA